uniref:Immunoglobulin V-set domain-containing protein n=1 Tax=Astatotilapia calliptera TaxID=8154 RepID=A0A3P8QS78_ASTCA
MPFWLISLRCLTSAVGMIHVTGYGYSESVSCPYESQYQNSLKYICRGNQPSTCLQQALITSDTKQNGRFRLDDDKMLGTFTVTINSLTRNDSGSYLCGVQRHSELDVFSAVELEVEGKKITVIALYTSTKKTLFANASRRSNCILLQLPFKWMVIRIQLLC